MPFVPATNVVQAELVFNWSDQVVENVLHYQVAGGPTPAHMTEIGAALVSWFGSGHDVIVGDEVQLTEVRLTDLTTQFSPGVTFTAGLPIVGGHVSPSLPNNVSIAITKRTALRGRAYRGRIYHIGLTESQVTENAVSPTTLATIIDSYESIRELTISAGTIPMVVVSRYLGGDERSAALVNVIIGFSSDGIVDSQRRRLPRRGQ